MKTRPTNRNDHNKNHHIDHIDHNDNSDLSFSEVRGAHAGVGAREGGDKWGKRERVQEGLRSRRTRRRAEVAQRGMREAR